MALYCHQNNQTFQNSLLVLNPVLAVVSTKALCFVEKYQFGKNQPLGLRSFTSFSRSYSIGFLFASSYLYFFP